MASNSVVSAWRQALDENWDEIRSITDWMGISAMHDHVAELRTGAGRAIGGDWVDHSLVRHLQPLAQRLATRDGIQTANSLSCPSAVGQDKSSKRC
jgi:hypothetical protein